MNKAYKVVRNGNGQMVVTSELGKTQNKFKPMAVMVAVMGLLVAQTSFAVPIGGYGGPGIPRSASFAGVKSGTGITVKNEGYLIGGDNGGNYFNSVINLSDDVQAKLDKISTLETQVKDGKDGIDALTEGAVMYDSAAKDKVTLNQNGGGSVLTNVKDGSIVAGSKDAVNGGQLFDVKTTAEKAVADAATAQSTANTANTKAVAADAKAVTADGKATAAQTTANKAVTDAAAASNHSQHRQHQG